MITDETQRPLRLCGLTLSGVSTMPDEPVLLSLDGPIATLTLNRPAALNALDEQMADALYAALVRVEHHKEARCLVVRGAGESFMAGGDVKAFAQAVSELSPTDRQPTFEQIVGRVHASILVLRHLPLPVVAAVHGAVAGFGVSLMLACDLAIAADNAGFALAYCQIGTSPDGGATFHLPRAVGMKRAMEIALLGDRFDARAAEDIGLVNVVVPAANLEREVAKLAARLAAGPTAAYARTKELLTAAFDHNLATHLGWECDRFVASTATGDFAEGVTAFVEKRGAKFEGR
jgi:2-(1,2-epoxy-1,2-dihydrophenyl)acetyl-CoA isomerase